MSNYRRLVAILIALVAFPAGAAGQQRATISGRVADAASGAGLSAVSVTVAGTTLGTISNAEGRFTLTNVPAV